MALASPVRACAVTKVRHPAALLGAYSLAQRPGTEALWIMPVDLLKDKLREAALGVKQRYGSVPSEIDDAVEFKEQKTQSIQFLKLRLIDRLLLLKEMTSYFVASSSKMNGRLTKIIPHRWKSANGSLTPRDIKSMVWREDMPEFVLECMGKEVVRTLESVSRRAEECPEREKNFWSLTGDSASTVAEAIQKMNIMENMHCGAILIMSGDSSSALMSKQRAISTVTNPDNKADPEEHAAPLGLEQTMVQEPTTSPTEKISDRLLYDSLDYLTLPQTHSKVPIFNLSALLSPHHLERIRGSHPRFQDDALFFSPKGKVGIDAILSLWRLKGSVMHDRYFLKHGGF
jgi:hypothetical protein